IPAAGTAGAQGPGIPSNDPSIPDFDPFANPAGLFAGQGNYDVSFGIDPTNPNVVYLGGTADNAPYTFIRVDTTGVSDAHSFYLANDRRETIPAALRVNTADPIQLQKPNQGPSGGPAPGTNEPRSIGNPVGNPVLNLVRDPNAP